MEPVAPSQSRLRKDHLVVFAANTLLLIAVSLAGVSVLAGYWNESTIMICLMSAIIGTGLRIEAAIRDGKSRDDSHTE